MIFLQVFGCHSQYIHWKDGLQAFSLRSCGFKYRRHYSSCNAGSLSEAYTLLFQEVKVSVAQDTQLPDQMPSTSSTTSEGEEIRHAAYALGMLTPTGVGPGVQGIAMAFGFLSILSVSVRVWISSGASGASSRTWGAEDYMIVASTVSL